MRSVVPYAPPQPFSIRPDLVDPSGDIAVWFTDPPGVIFQFTRPLHSTIEHADGHTVLELDDPASDQDVLTAALKTGPVHEFSLRRPSLTELFREVVTA